MESLFTVFACDFSDPLALLLCMRYTLEAIMQGTSLKNCSRVIERTAAVVQAYEIFGVLYYAFSTHPLKNCNKKQLLSLVRHKEAILYPWMPQMVHDFPEIFSHKDNS